MRKISPADRGVSGKATIPKEWLRIDQLLDEDGNVEGQPITWNRKGPGRYELVVLDPDNYVPLDGLQLATDGGKDE